MNELLDELVPPFEDAGDWDDVLRRAGRRRRRRLRPAVVAAVVAASAVAAAAPALAVFLRHDGPGLPDAADRSNVAVVVEPHTGRVLVQAAPWKGRRGFCYVVLRTRAGCVPRTAHGTVVTSPPLFGWTFDERVRSAVATTAAGARLPLRTARFGGRIDATLFVLRDRLPRDLRSVELRDAAGRVVARVRIR